MSNAKVEAYLDAEFRRYFPDASMIGIDIRDDVEMIDVSVHWDDNFVEYRMEIGSDDNWYEFFCEELQSTLTIPFNPEGV